MDKSLIKEYALRELARRDFFTYCNYMAPDFYKGDRAFLVDLCHRLQDFIESAEKVMVVNMPPRHGKSRTAGNLVEWLLGQSNKYKIMTGSYNENLSGTFAKKVRDTIQEEKTEGIRSYCDIFPHTKIKYGEASMKKWALEESQEANYLATSPKGTATGFGCNIMILDDLIKNADEAYNEDVLEGIIDWFNNTMLSRTENGFKIIIIMTRWAKGDLAGHILETYPDAVHINYAAQQSDGSMLCSDILSKEDFDFKTKDMNKDIVLANYQQEPIDIKGRLYTSFKTYDRLPVDEQGNSLLEGIYSYTDTADEGKDYLCTIIWGAYLNEAYVLDVYYTQDGMEITEPEVAKRFKDCGVNMARIESNNGGSGFARNVKRISEQELQNYATVVKWFHQSKNKRARILSNATWIMNHVHYPNNWMHKWPEYYKAMLRYQRDGENKHDDGPDCTTGVAETMYKLGV